MIDFIVNNLNCLVECNYLLGDKNDPNSMFSLLQYLFTAIKIATPCIIIALITIDFVKGASQNSEKAVHEAFIKSIKRLIAGVALFFTPTIVNIVLELANLTGTCSIS